MRKPWPGPAPPRRPSYLFATLSDGGRELTDYHIHTLDTGLFKLLHLLFHCGFKSEVRCEEARPAPGRRGNRTGCSQGGQERRRRRGVKAKRSQGAGCRMAGARGKRERDTDTEKEREERRQCERWAWPSCYHPDWHLPGVAKRRPPQGSEGMGWV